MRIAAVALLMVLAACSGGSSEPSGPATTTPAGQGVATPTNPPPTGVPVPEALSAFQCESDGTGTYTASGALKNDTKATVTFQVTVNVGRPGTAPQAAATRQLPKVGAGDSVTFEITKVPIVDESGACHVQVVTTK